MIGSRDANAAYRFIGDLAARLATRVQVITDGLKAYLNAIEDALGTDVDYAMRIEIYGEPTKGQKRYGPADCLGCKKESQIGNPDPKHISTSYVVGQNLTMRMSMRRFTRLTNGFSKKVANHASAIALHFRYYNFGRKHQTLKMSPAMASGITTKLWSIADIVALIGGQPGGGGGQHQLFAVTAEVGEAGLIGQEDGRVATGLAGGDEQGRGVLSDDRGPAFAMS